MPFVKLQSTCGHEWLRRSNHSFKL